MSCPQCESADFAMSMPAVRNNGHISVSTSSYSAVGFTTAGVVPVLGSASNVHTQQSVVATMTAPEPPERPLTGMAVAAVVGLVGFAVFVVPVLWIALNHETSHGANDLSKVLTVAFCAIFAIPGVAAVVAAVRQAAFNRRVARGRPRTRAVWSAGWYCGRCGGCYWPEPVAAAGVPVGRLLAPREFQRIVWSLA
jgi:hypothetical protein